MRKNNGDEEQKYIDNRYLIRISDKKMAITIQRTMKREGLSQQEFMNKYVDPHLPKEDYDLPHQHYKRCTEEFYKICSQTLKPQIIEAFGLFWVIIFKVYKNELNINDVMATLNHIIWHK